MTPVELNAYRLRAEARILAQRYKKQNKREFTPWSTWYPWQLELFESHEKQIMTLAGNRSGKTMAHGFRMACNLTGKYPDEWTGMRFEHGINGLAMGVDNQQLRDVVQKELFGDVYENQRGKKRFTGGWVHQSEIGRIEWSPQMTGLARRVEVLGSYGMAACTLRSYTQSKTGQGSLSFAGTSIDYIWVDECPPDDLVGQLIIRTMTGNYNRGGYIIYSMTPELGATDLVAGFLNHREEGQQLIGPISWDECPHLTVEIQNQMLSSLPDHEREMRSQGTPYFGSGLCYTVPDSRIRIDPFLVEKIPWLRFIRAMDVGIDHPTAIVWLAYDAEIDRIYVLRTYSVSGETAAAHAAAANSYMPNVPIVFPHDINQREKGSGKTLREYYADAGLTNSIDFANPDGSRFVEPGELEIHDRMKTDRFKVTSDCDDFFREKRLYHRKDGKIVPKNDDVLSAVRYGAMMITRFGTEGNRRVRKPKVLRSIV